ALARELPAAALVRDDGALGAWVQAIVRHLSGAQATIELPLDVRATAFQQRVWQALLAIPYGATRTYGEVAAALGQPTAARAVARACATNPVALVVPCHRVVGEGGELRGYRWGVERKRQLLEHEAAAPVESHA
ncbi:MAG TPA: methylated-DNA--[protein]-cysteine S-methyltransferase, partial [Kouleothrix sp.]|nr:methylated-DNA--[protein]-cysteine S-methyltransferase [Kouleothrix sp.]